MPRSIEPNQFWTRNMTLRTDDASGFGVTWVGGHSEVFQCARGTRVVCRAVPSRVQAAKCIFFNSLLI